MLQSDSVRSDLRTVFKLLTSVTALLSWGIAELSSDIMLCVLTSYKGTICGISWCYQGGEVFCHAAYHGGGK